jgi:hypothetical protein
MITNLGINKRTSVMDGICNLLPSRNLFFIPDARGQWPLRAENDILENNSNRTRQLTKPLTRNKNAFGDYETCTSSSALGIVFGHQVGRNSAGRTVAG